MSTSHRWTRREFLGRSLTGALGGFAALPVMGEALRRIPGPRPQAAGAVLTRTLGRTGITLPVVNMGVMNADIPMLVQRAYEQDMRLFDTAAVYMRGRNEEMVGTVLQTMGVRDKAVIATKVMLSPPQRRAEPDKVRDAFLASAEASLKRLKTDHVDILFNHSVSIVEDVRNPGVLEALGRLKKEGKALHVGFSTHTNMAACLDAAVDLGFYDVVLTTFNYSYHDDPVLPAALKKAHAAGIGLIAMKTQCNSVDWYRSEVPAERRGFYEGEIQHGALLKWVLQHDFITAAVPGFTTFDQLDADAVCARSLEMTPAESKFLEDRGVKKLLAGACHLCGACVAGCPRGADIPGLLRAHMYALSYGNRSQAGDVLAAIPRDRGLAACSDCTECVAQCRREVPIGARIGALKGICAGADFLA